MAAKKSFVLRMDHEKFDAVEKWAADEFRSTNGQLEWIIDQALKKAGRTKKQVKPSSDQKSEEGSERP